ncbi:SLC13 family permease [Pacificibacter marinus]|uniref:Sodium-dependent dicarboxylate transporter SdcS n=1 Tax=Pacificibacter marinus TaxID=658057 RepID=A0A1Y5TFP2_9RHOB|nr:SLC13 family permease [Pacificibacter marinus]SEL16815.1 Citrate transporter [Pacificibacter marinus]SLN62998.1 Sodium-dependent dicarboxylate transporter SdcS [Pacificibacter marinus]
MPSDQSLIIGIFAVLFVLLVWGRIRYDLVAFGALVLAAILGLVPAEDVFSGFGHSAVAIIALVLIISRGLVGSGAIEKLAARLLDSERPLPLHIAVMAVVGAGLSAVINNVAALALLMPLDIDTATKAKRGVSLSLMPLSFATILGGMITLIGTPPNIVIAAYRQDVLGTPFGMFDFAPVGFTVAVVGIAYVSLVGWRLLPKREGALEQGSAFSEGRYIAELRVSEKATESTATVSDLYPLADDHDVHILGLVRRGKRLRGFAAKQDIKAGDFIVVEGEPKSIEAFMGQAALEFSGHEKHAGGVTSGGLTLTEAIVPEGARIAGRTARGLKLLYQHSVTLLGVSRNGQRFTDRVRLLTIKPGDVLLLLGDADRNAAAASFLGVLPLEGRETPVVQRSKASLSIGIFLAAIGAAVVGWISLPVALSAAVIALIAVGLVSGREVYDSIEWKVIVLLASLIPLAEAFAHSGGAELIATQILSITDGYPAWVSLLALMIVTMTLSDFLNNVATTLIAAPIAIGMAAATGTNPDAWLMTVAVAASCAFLTPIGHKNNTIILGPGGYRFGDYWKMGLLLEVIVVIVAVPAILLVWPL